MESFTVPPSMYMRSTLLKQSIYRVVPLFCIIVAMQMFSSAYGEDGIVENKRVYISHLYKTYLFESALHTCLIAGKMWSPEKSAIELSKSLTKKGATLYQQYVISVWDEMDEGKDKLKIIKVLGGCQKMLLDIQNNDTKDWASKIKNQVFNTPFRP